MPERKRKIVKDLTEATSKELAEKLKRNIRRDRKSFQNLLEQNSPEINKEQVFEDFSGRSRVLSKRLVDLATKSLAIINAVYYANTALSNSLGADNTAYNYNEITVQLRKVLRIKIARLICREFKLDDEYEKQVIYHIIDREFAKSIPQGFSYGTQVSSNQNSKRSTEKGKAKTG